jgi:subtilisin family serine protease
LLILLIVGCFHGSAVAAPIPVIVQLSPLTNVNIVAQLLGGTVLDSIPGVNTHLLSVPALPLLSGLQLSLLGIVSIEVDNSVPIGTSPRFAVLTVPGSTPSDWYKNQPEMIRIRAGEAQSYSTGAGIVVADLNSNVDVSHPALIGHLTGGYDFVSARAGYAGNLNQSSSGFLDQSSSGFLDQSSSGFLDQSSSGFLDNSGASLISDAAATMLDSGNPAYSHGTLCAGVIAAIAPNAAIMPLRVFDDSGSTDVFSIAKAIYYARQHGVQVINMSFGVDGNYSVVQSAITAAQNANVTIVASAGNANTSVAQYPAAYSGVISVAATDNADRKASFSNYGSSVAVVAPGVNVISAFPGGYYGLASGTSFSSPMVAAEAALVRSLSPTGTRTKIVSSTVNIDSLNPGYAGKLGSGRIDLMRAVQ